MTAECHLLGWLVWCLLLHFIFIFVAGWDDGISSSASERFFCGDLFMIDEIGGGLSLISANKAMI